MTRRGMTLVELLVVLAILGLMASIAAFSTAAAPAPEPPSWQLAVTRARRTALRTGRSVSTYIEMQGGVVSVTALPDGSIVADRRIPVERLAGRPGPASVRQAAR